jgi:mannosyltransferase
MIGGIALDEHRTRWHYGPLVLVLLAFGLYVLNLGVQGLWMDEVITVERSSLSLPGILSDLLDTRNHMPLYFLGMHLWLKGGTGEFWVRFPSVVWAVLGVAVTVRLGADLGGRRVGALAGLLLAAAPLYNWHAQDARMYSMAAFWVIAATWSLLRAWRG